MTNSSSCYIPEELLNPSAQQEMGTEQVGAINTQQIRPALLWFFLPSGRAKSSLLFKFLLSAGRSQAKFVSPGITVLHYPLVWAGRCLWGLHLLQNFIWEKGAWLRTATRPGTQEKCDFAFHAKPREDFPPRGR